MDEAIAHYQRALEIKPDYNAVHYNLGNMLAGCGQVAKAIAYFRKALEIRPNDAGIRRNLAVARSKRK